MIKVHMLYVMHIFCFYAVYYCWDQRAWIFLTPASPPAKKKAVLCKDALLRSLLICWCTWHTSGAQNRERKTHRDSFVVSPSLLPSIHCMRHCFPSLEGCCSRGACRDMLEWFVLGKSPNIVSGHASKDLGNPLEKNLLAWRRYWTLIKQLVELYYLI